MLRRATLGGTVPAQICTPWVNARGDDMAYLNGYIFVMEGATGMKLWAYKLGAAVTISEPAKWA
jgi:hypothetical protein